MMPDLGKYTVAVLSAYGGTLLLLAGLVGWSWRQGAKARRALDEAEARRG